MPQAKPGHKNREIAPGIPAEPALRRIVAGCTCEIERQLARLMVDDSPDAPHGARVALRQLRAALTGFAPIIDRATLTATKAEAKALFRALGPLRDADVAAAEALGAPETAARQAQAATLREAVRKTLRRSPGAAKMQARLFGKGWRRKGHKARRWRSGRVGPLAERALTRAWARVATHPPGIAPMTAADRHELRKDLKTLRYLCDFLGPLWPGKGRKRFLAHLAPLLDALGTLNDLAIARQRAPASTAAQARAASAMTKAETAWRALRKAGPFWA
ncbi:MAG: CHAD domain-containing protein [Pseudorhodobacter sp.]|nr:CHAD domain-containing protein [Pseudorhodobacter sp.]